MRTINCQPCDTLVTKYNCLGESYCSTLCNIIHVATFKLRNKRWAYKDGQLCVGEIDDD